MSSNSFKNNVIKKLFAYESYMICMHKQDLVLNNPQGLICLKIQPKHQSM